MLHEKRQARSLHQRQRLDPNAVIPIRIGLKQNNLEGAYERLMNISHPSSENYGQHLSAEEVHPLFAPTTEAIETVREWLLSSGTSNVRPYVNKGWLAIDISTKDAERLLSTVYYQHETSDGYRIGCDEYYLPAHVSRHVDLAKPGVTMSPPLKKRIAKRNASPYIGRQGKPIHTPPGHYPHWEMPSAVRDLPEDLQSCSVNITPVCLKALYQLPTLNFSSPDNVMGVYENEDMFAQQDLDLFFENFAPWVPQGTSPIVTSVDGGTAPVAPESIYNTGESDIDSE